MPQIAKKIRKKNGKNGKIFKLTENRIFLAEFVQNKDFVVFKFPSSILNYFGISENPRLGKEHKKIYYTAIDGVIQISPFKPSVAIPVLAYDKKSFLSQTADVIS